MHSSKINIRFSDIDDFGHVNNAVYLTYLEEARVRFFDDVVGSKYEWKIQGIILAKAEIDFVHPLHFRDEAFIEIRCHHVGSKSFQLNYKILKVDNDQEILITSAMTVMVAFDYATNKSVVVPEEWKEILIQHQ